MHAITNSLSINVISMYALVLHIIAINQIKSQNTIYYLNTSDVTKNKTHNKRTITQKTECEIETTMSASCKKN